MKIEQLRPDTPAARDASTARSSAGRPECAHYGDSPTTLYAARGRLIPFNSNSPTGSTCLIRCRLSGGKADLAVCEYTAFCNGPDEVKSPN